MVMMSMEHVVPLYWLLSIPTPIRSAFDASIGRIEYHSQQTDRTSRDLFVVLNNENLDHYSSIPTLLLFSFD